MARKPAASVAHERIRYEPVLEAPVLRSAASTLLAGILLIERVPPSTISLFLIAWWAGIAVTQKYVHKYPYRYVSYVLASHMKATMAALLVYWGLAAILDMALTASAAWPFAILTGVDLLLSLPHRRVSTSPPSGQFQLQRPSNTNSPSIDADKREHERRPDEGEIIGRLPAEVIAAMALVSDGAGPSHVANAATGPQTTHGHSGVVAIATPLNDIRRINKTLLAGTERLLHGGHVVCRYRPLEHEKSGLLRTLLVFAWHRACSKVPLVERLYFVVTQGRNRRLSRAEVWGRLAFCGFSVVYEREGAIALVVARKDSALVTDRRPSYYPVVGLAKVGLDGSTLTTHKIRSMYPYSEFIQKQVFEANGLAAAGKIRNDFRVTTYGRYLRRYWLDEIPQVFDWLRGDIKLVGIRATSHHFLGLYPPEFVEMYIQAKPGLVPPLFNEATAGFDEIVAVERNYLEAYLQRPIYTDLVNLYRSLRDIALRGVRSN